MKKSLPYCLIFCFCLAFSACEDEDDIAVEQVLLVYLGGDNNLSWEADAKRIAIMRGWNGEVNTRILIYQDPSNATPTLQEVIRQNGENTTRTIATYDEENSASAGVFARVVADVKRRYRPTVSYGLLVFSHGTGWLPQSTYTQPRSSSLRTLVVDHSDEMDIIDMAATIPDGTFEYIIFEACLMANIEVAYEFRNKTNYILASSAEILSPGFTGIYSASINHLWAGYNGLKSFAEDAFSHWNNQAGQLHSATFSIIKTAELQPLATFIKENADTTKTVDISAIQHFDRHSYHLFFDFEDYYSRLLDSDNQREELTHLIDNAVVWAMATETFMPEREEDGQIGFSVDKHSGMTSYIPQASFPFLNEEYKKLHWANIR
ncbi:clostripain [Bacteroidia bacterium]|nr:clostripain [Bacteroidia bacterium]